ncbi:hypothetical protein [Sporolactobacillus sp. THM19-2]|uniref:hypothetical protein n=1 Tax=Sporolactobacillus sp. THM19-2 TaxID=2511171 RepID=UPI00101EA391|nr:hypothetical protein [Sporolactobacillus sp. THM19-2]RYL94452.1 hypothetical protein EWH91_00235 [Sporolactobacillus sp. THM19-2]
MRLRSAQYVMIGVTILNLLFVCLTPLLLSGGMTESSDQVEVVARLTGTICSILFPSLTAMLGFIMILIPVAAYFLMRPDFRPFVWILVMVLVAANLIAVLLLRTRGVRLYDHLE